MRVAVSASKRPRVSIYATYVARQVLLLCLVPSAWLRFGTSQTVSESVRSSLTATPPIDLSIWKVVIDMDHGDAYSSLPTTIPRLCAAVSWDPFRQYTAPGMWQVDVWQMPAASNTTATGRRLLIQLPRRAVHN